LLDIDKNSRQETTINVSQLMILYIYIFTIK
jgi:hypothetical protein